MNLFSHFLFALIVAILAWGTVTSFIVFFNQCVIILLGLESGSYGNTIQNNTNNDTPKDSDDDDGSDGGLNPRKWLVLSLIYLGVLILILWTSGFHLHDAFGMNVEALE